MANKIQIRRGLKVNLPSLDVGEPALCTDTKEVFVGNSGGNVALINKEAMDDHLKNYTLQVPYAQAAGSANVYTASLNPALTAYTEGVAIAVKINVANTGASTINVNGLGAKSIRDPRGNTRPAGKLTAGSIYTLRYNGTNFILQGEGASGNATASDLLSGKTASTDAGDITGAMPNRTSHVTAQSSSVSGTTLRLRPQAGYYNGLTTNSVQIDNEEFIASNIRSGVNLFGVTGTAFIVDDQSGAPGATTLIAGNMNAGYFGAYSGIYTGNTLYSACGISSQSEAINYASTNISWLKFAYENKIIFIAQKPLRMFINWTIINNAGCVYGKTLSKGGVTYKCRLMRGGNGDPSSGAGGEWNALFYKIHGPEGEWAQFSNVDLHIDYQSVSSGWATICTEKTTSGGTVNRGTSGIISYGGDSMSDIGGQMSWRPVLEVVQ